MFAIKWHTDPELRKTIDKKRNLLLDQVDASLKIETAWEYDEMAERAKKTEQADYLLEMIRTLDRDDFETLIKAYSYNPPGSNFYAGSIPVGDTDERD